jgi:hypothetical protein
MICGGCLTLTNKLRFKLKTEMFVSRDDGK